MSIKYPAGWDRFYRVIRRIPKGRIATYGAIARAAGEPHSARQVGFALAALPASPRPTVPWQRVLGSRARGWAAITVRDPLGAAEQRAKLESEGVVFDARGRVALQRFGWHAILFLAFLFSGAASGAPTALPDQPRGQCVLDEAHALDAASFSELERLCESLDRSGAGQIEIAVTADLRDRSKEEFAVDLSKKWGIGHRGKDDGLLVLLKVGPPGQRGIKIEVGYGLEGILPDGKVGAMRDAALPFLKKAQWGPGLVQLVTSLIAVVAEDASHGGAAARASANASRAGNEARDALLALILSALFFAALLALYVRRRLPSNTLIGAGAALGGGLALLMWITAVGLVAWAVLAIGAAVNSWLLLSIAQHRCPRCGRWMLLEGRVLAEPTHFRAGEAVDLQSCAACGYQHQFTRMLQPFGGPYVSGGGGGFGGGDGGGFSGGGGGGSGGGGAGGDF